MSLSVRWKMVPHVSKANKNEYKDLNDKNIDYT